MIEEKLDKSRFGFVALTDLEAEDVQFCAA